MKERWIKYWLVLPGVLAVLASAVWPLVEAFYLSFRDWRLNRAAQSKPLWLPSDGWGEIGWLFENYVRAFQDPSFWNAPV